MESIQAHLKRGGHYEDRVAAAGKAEYDLPMVANAWPKVSETDLEGVGQMTGVFQQEDDERWEIEALQRLQ